MREEQPGRRRQEQMETSWEQEMREEQPGRKRQKQLGNWWVQEMREEQLESGWQERLQQGGLVLSNRAQRALQ